MERVKVASLLATSALALMGVIMTSPCYGAWVVTYHGDLADCANSVQQTADGGYVAAGYTWSFGAGDADLWVLKLNDKGDCIWQKTYGGPGYDVANCVQQTTDGGFIVAGTTASYGAGDTDLWVLRLNPDGSIAWQSTYGGPGSEEAHSIQQTFDGLGDPDGYIVASSSSSFGGGQDAWVLKLGPEGSVAWQGKWNGTELAHSIRQTSDGGYVMAGTISAGGAGNEDFWVMKLDSQGSKVWQRAYGGANLDRAYCVRESFEQGVADGYVVAGLTKSFGAGGTDVWVLKLGLDGSILWEKAYGGTGNDSGYCIVQAPDGGWILVGPSGSWLDYPGGPNVWVLKLHPDGSVHRQRTYGKPWHDNAFSVEVTADGGCVVGGYIEPYLSSAWWGAWVLKLDQDGSAPNCGFLALSTAAEVYGTEAVVSVANLVYQPTDANPDDGWAVSPQLSQAAKKTDCTPPAEPVIDGFKRRRRKPGRTLKMYGSGFENGGTVHIGRRTFDDAHDRVLLWTDTEIWVRVPNYKCKWFGEKEIKRRKVWVTVRGVDSNIKRIKIVRPDRCL